MAKLSYLTSTWDNIKEVDLGPIRQQALRGVRIAIVGAPGSGRSTLAYQLRRDPSRAGEETDTPLLIVDLETAAPAAGADLIMLVVDSRKADTAREQELVLQWQNSGKKVLVIINQFEELSESMAISPWTSRGGRRVVWGSLLDTHFLVAKLAQAVIELAPDHLLALGRFFPLFRVPIAHYLINDTCFTNSAYSLSTALAETVAIFNIPIAVTDMIVLSKNQAFLAYKLGLSLGYSTRWQDYIAEFGGVLGAGFLWRETARTLVGFIPLWGIVPKVAIAYAGTYIVGTTILQWYLTGRHISKEQVRGLYRGALLRGRNVAKTLLNRIPRPRLPRRSRRALPAGVANRTCANCGRASAADAGFCQYCGSPFTQGVIQNASSQSPTSSSTL
jgi:uncharacterized protein (DUF697 family)